MKKSFKYIALICITLSVMSCVSSRFVDTRKQKTITIDDNIGVNIQIAPSEINNLSQWQAVATKEKNQIVLTVLYDYKPIYCIIATPSNSYVMSNYKTNVPELLRKDDVPCREVRYFNDIRK